jgi:sugar phosphate isomerase/epimerase
MPYTRRDFGKLALAALPAAAFALPNSKVMGVQIGIITYSLRQGIPKSDLPAVIAKLGLNSVELMSGDAEALAAATPATWQGVRKQFTDQRVDLQILCYNMGVNITDQDIDYAFRMAQALGVSAISSSSTVAVAKRVAPIAAKYKMMWGGHGHNNITDPEQFGSEDSFEKIMEFGDYIGANLDVGHYNQTGADAVAFIQRHHDRITNVHIKDSTKPTEPDTVSNTLTPWGKGNAPIKQVLQLMRKEQYRFPANIEFEYAIPPGSDVLTEIAKCVDYARACLEM